MRTRTRSETNNFIKQVEAENEGPMKEITDERLSELRASLSVCNPLVQSLVARLDRVEGEKEESQRTISRLEENALYGQGYLETAYTENTALRERVKRDRLYFEKISLLATPPSHMAAALDEIYDVAQAVLKEGG